MLANLFVVILNILAVVLLAIRGKFNFSKDAGALTAALMGFLGSITEWKDMPGQIRELTVDTAIATAKQVTIQFKHADSDLEQLLESFAITAMMFFVCIRRVLDYFQGSVLPEVDGGELSQPKLSGNKTPW